MRHWYECLGDQDHDPLKLRCNRERGRFAGHPDVLLSLFSDRPARGGGGWRQCFGLTSPGVATGRRMKRSSPA